MPQEFGCPFHRGRRSPEQACTTGASASSSCISASSRRHPLVAGTPPVSGSRDGLLHPPSIVSAEIRQSPILLATGEHIPQTPSPFSLDFPPHGRPTPTGTPPILVGQEFSVHWPWRPGGSHHHLFCIDKVVLPFGPYGIPKPNSYSLCLATFTHNPLEISHLLHIKPTMALLPASPYPLIFSRALLSVSCRSSNLTLVVYS
jgi:hypothetical protein